MDAKAKAQAEQKAERREVSGADPAGRLAQRSLLTGLSPTTQVSVGCAAYGGEPLGLSAGARSRSESRAR